MTGTVDRPSPSEYNPHYEQYIRLVPEKDVISTLKQQESEYVEFFQSIPESQGQHAYEPGKWTIKEVIGHIIDTERIMAYRALWFARNDQAPLPGFEQDDFMRYSNFNNVSIADLAAEFSHLRKSNVYMFEGFGDDVWERTGVASNNKVTVRALAYIVAGHVAHHAQILRAKYL